MDHSGSIHGLCMVIGDGCNDGILNFLFAGWCQIFSYPFSIPVQKLLVQISEETLSNATKRALVAFRSLQDLEDSPTCLFSGGQPAKSVGFSPSKYGF